MHTFNHNEHHEKWRPVLLEKANRLLATTDDEEALPGSNPSPISLLGVASGAETREDPRAFALLSSESRSNGVDTTVNPLVSNEVAIKNDH